MVIFFFCKHKAACEMRISDGSSACALPISLAGRVAVWKHARDALQHVDGRVSAPIGDGPVENHMSVEDGSHSIGDGFVVIPALDQHGEDTDRKSGVSGKSVSGRVGRGVRRIITKTIKLN